MSLQTDGSKDIVTIMILFDDRLDLSVFPHFCPIISDLSCFPKMPINIGSPIAILNRA